MGIWKATRRFAKWYPTASLSIPDDNRLNFTRIEIAVRLITS
jgi:hypothetical protein